MPWTPKLLKVQHGGAEIAVVATMNGLPVWTDETGKEETHSYEDAAGKIRAAGTARDDEKKLRVAAEAALAPFAGLDPVAARKAVDTYKLLDQKTLLDAEGVAKLREEWTRSHAEATTKLETEYKAKLATAEARLGEASIRQAIAGSKAGPQLGGAATALKGDLTIGPAAAFDLFAKHARADADGKVTFFHDAGKFEKPMVGTDGTALDPGAALRKLVAEYPDAATISVLGQGRGSGQPNGGPGGGAAKQVSAEQFEAIPLAERNAFFKDGGTIALA